MCKMNPIFYRLPRLAIRSPRTMVTGATPTYTGGAPTSWTITLEQCQLVYQLIHQLEDYRNSNCSYAYTVTLTIEAINAAGFSDNSRYRCADEPPSSITQAHYIHQERCCNRSNSNLHRRCTSLDICGVIPMVCQFIHSPEK